MTTPASGNARPAWFVGAYWDGQDQTDRFVREGIWENGHTNGKFFDQVSEIQSGDWIAIKSLYTRKNGLPFDNRGESVSTMRIKAIGIVKENMRDGRQLKVKWNPINELKDWYFHTGGVWDAVCPIYPGTWDDDQLIGFTFSDQEQDYDAFRNDPRWREKFGDLNTLHLPGPPNQIPPLQTVDTYTTTSIVDDGCFLPHAILETILRRLESKQNIILQGPPGTGKTWLAKRLAYALIGQKDDSKVRSFQFHPNMSYEDFVRGWRPDGKNGLSLVDGPFLELSEVARKDPDSKYVIVIEEINRGNPASTFGELLTLLEADKRKADEALALAYPRSEVERFHIPPNVYVIGTMNTADRSIAMIDLALRRRFAFFNLEPQLNDAWREWVSEECEIPQQFLSDIAQRIASLNDQIANDRNLGRQFRIGHSHVTPPPSTSIDDPTGWFREIVETEIAPLLCEYWFDNSSIADEAIDTMLAGLQ